MSPDVIERERRSAVVTSAEVPEFLTVREVGRLTKASDKAVWAWIHGGQLAAVRVGKAWLVPADALRALQDRAKSEAQERARARSEVMA